MTRFVSVCLMVGSVGGIVPAVAAQPAPLHPFTHEGATRADVVEFTALVASCRSDQPGFTVALDALLPSPRTIAVTLERSTNLMFGSTRNLSRGGPSSDSTWRPECPSREVGPGPSTSVGY